MRRFVLPAWPDKSKIKPGNVRGLCASQTIFKSTSLKERMVESNLVSVTLAAGAAAVAGEG